MRIDIFAIFNLFLTIVFGTFLFKDDEHLKSFYECLATTICQPCAEQGQSGLACLMPLTVTSFLNAITDLLMRGPLFRLMPMPYLIFLVGSIAAQLATGYFSWMVFKVVREAAPIDSGLELGFPGRPTGGIGGYRRPPGSSSNEPPAQQDVAATNGNSLAGGVVAPSAGFVAFAGNGNRLGS